MVESTGIGRDRWGRRIPAILLPCAVLASCVVLLVVAGDLMLRAFPVSVEISGSGRELVVGIDGQAWSLALAEPVVAVRFPAGSPHRREYQIDGSDSTNNFTLDEAYFRSIADASYYRFQGFLRQEGTYSRWQNLTVLDRRTSTTEARASGFVGERIDLPAEFGLSVELHRVEAPRSIELLAGDGSGISVEINRNDKRISISAVDEGGREVETARWYFPLDWRPPLAELVHLATRVAAMALALPLVLGPVAAVLPMAPLPTSRRWPRAAVPLLAAGVVLGASCYTGVVLFDRAPHVLDAISYYFQAKIFASGALAAPAPPVEEAFLTPFTVVHQGRWFSMYPPGTPAVLALGFLVGVPWLVEPLLAAAAALLTYHVGRRQYGPNVPLLAAVLLAASPFLHLLAGSFMSHVPAMFFGTCCLYAATRYVQAPERRWAVLGAGALGATFLTREITAMLFGLVLGAFVAARVGRARPWRCLADGLAALACLCPIVVAYFAYGAALTGSPLVHPRILFSPTENSFGFGEGVGFYGRHTVAAGLVNADELLTSLTISLFGWPFYASLALIAAPFIFRRATWWDAVHGALFAVVVVAFVGLYYHGIALGPRYYSETLPSLALLTARGFATLAGVAASILAVARRDGAAQSARAAALALCAGLLACTATYFVPRQVALYRDYSGMPGAGGPLLGDFVRRDLAGRVPQVADALVTTDDWRTYAVYFAAMNCPRLDCDAVFAYAPDIDVRDRLRAAFPGRTWHEVRTFNNRLVIVPGEAAP